MPRLFLLTLFALLALAAPAGATVTVSSPSVAESGDLQFSVTVSIDEISAQVTAADGTATAASGDYGTPSPQTAMGGTTTTVTVPVTDDNVSEGDETMTLRAQGTLGGEGTGTGTILDNDPRALSIRDAVVNEAAGAVDLTVDALPASAGAPASSVPFSTAAGTAADNQDFSPSSGTLNVPAGASRATIRIPITNDTADENDESFTVTLGAPTGATVADNQASVTITNDDLRALTVGDVTVREGDGANTVARVPITLSAPTFRSVTLAYATIDGIARAPRDYLSRFGAVTIPAGQTSAVVELAIASDETRERREVFGVLIGRPAGATVGRGAALVTVDDDDGPEGDTTPPNVRVTRVRLSGRRITARVSCPRTEQRCRGRLTLFTRADRRSPSRTLRRERRIGRVSYSLTGGRARTVRITVPASIRSAARRARRLRLRAFTVTDDANGNTGTKTTNATLRVRP